MQFSTAQYLYMYNLPCYFTTYYTVRVDTLHKLSKLNSPENNNHC